MLPLHLVQIFDDYLFGNISRNPVPVDTCLNGIREVGKPSAKLLITDFPNFLAGGQTKDETYDSNEFGYFLHLYLII